MPGEDLMPLIIACIFLIASCTTHDVNIKGPTEPVTINLNVDLKHKISVQMTEDVKKAIDKNDKIF